MLFRWKEVDSGKMISGEHLSSFEDEKCKGEDGGWQWPSDPFPLHPVPLTTLVQFRREKGVRKTKTRKAQKKTAGMSLSGGAPCANTTRQMDCSGHCAPLHHVPSRNKSNRPTVLVYSIVPRFPDEFTAEWPFSSTGIGRASMPTFSSPRFFVPAPLSRFPSSSSTLLFSPR